jgi:hypothetical protein
VVGGAEGAGGRWGVPRRVRLYRGLFVVVAVALAALVLRGRCQQLGGQRDEALERGLSTLSAALREGGDLEEARAAFQRAAAAAPTEAWPAFCVSAVDELAGRWSPAAATPEWTAAVERLRAGALPAASAAFAAFARADQPLAPRARYYERLIEALALR